MGSPIIRKSVDMTTGACGEAPVSFSQASGNVFANRIGVVRQGDVAVPHPSKRKHAGHAAVGGGTVYVNGKRRQVKGDSLTCGDISGGGSSNVFAG